MNNNLCAFAVEANVARGSRLRTVAAEYKKRGWRYTVFNPAALAGDREGENVLFCPSREEIYTVIFRGVRQYFF